MKHPSDQDPDNQRDTTFENINTGYNSVFCASRLSVGLVVPIEAYPDSDTPSMVNHLQRVQLAEQLGFSAVWLRDVPFKVPSFGDAGQGFDPFVYLGALAAATDRIALGVASVILPLRHPAHVAKAAASVDVISGGRLILGVASGDRPEEYPATNLSYSMRGTRFRDSFEYIRRMAEPLPEFQNEFGQLGGGLDMLPKPTASRIPLLVTGGSQQDPNWIATHADGWMIYPRDVESQSRIIQDWRNRLAAVGRDEQPVMQPLYFDLLEDPEARARSIHLGFSSGIDALRNYLKALEGVGVNHVALNLRFNRLDIETTLRHLSDGLLGDFI